MATTDPPADRAAPTGDQPGRPRGGGPGGGVGSALRWGVSSALPTAAGGVGWSTVVVNLTGSFLLGLLLAGLAGAAARRGGAAPWHHLARLGLGTGLLGGWTTFSTLAVEADRARAGRSGIAVVAVLVSLVGGVALAAAGTGVGRARPRARRGAR